jgi:HPt (histidine-containing phosphotransfer) domain-containing protein
MDACLSKPLSQKALATVLEQWALDGYQADWNEFPRLFSVDGRKVRYPEDDPSHIAVLDAEVIERLERVGEAAGEDLMRQLAALFLADADALIGALRDAVSREDAVAVLRTAHSLCGASANVGAILLSRMCATLGTGGIYGGLISGLALLQAIERELDRVRSALGVWMPSP